MDGCEHGMLVPRICVPGRISVPTSKWALLHFYTAKQGEARQSEGADAYHDGVADHFQRFTSANMVIARRYGRMVAIDKRGVVIFRDALFPSGFMQGKQGENGAFRGC